MEEKAAVCRHVKAVEEYMSREHEMGSVMERIIINANDDNDNDDVSESKLVVTIMVIYKELVQSSVAASEVK